MALAVEPMITLGCKDTEVLADDWTVVTADGSWAAHFEHTVALTENGPWVLTAPDGGAAQLAGGEAERMAAQARGLAWRPGADVE